MCLCELAVEEVNGGMVVSEVGRSEMSRLYCISGRAAEGRSEELSLFLDCTALRIEVLRRKENVAEGYRLQSSV
ncbi:hypothetical protein MHYP_G00131680 [Metynnis hypsauchen]